MGEHKWPAVICRDRGFMKGVVLKPEAVFVAESCVCFTQLLMISTC